MRSSMSSWTRRSIGAIALTLGGWITAAPVLAQDFPIRPMRVLIGFPAGSGADVLGRHFTTKLQELSGQPVLVDNKPGANANIAIGLLKNAKPDGYTMLFVANANMALNKWLFKSLPFDTVKDFTPVAAWAQLGFVVVVAPDAKVASMSELTEVIKSKPQAKYGTTNQTAIVSTAYYMQLAGLKATNVGYRTAPDAMPDVANGTLDFMIMDGTFALGQIRQGKLKPLAATSTWRIAGMPNVPTMDEAGFKGFDFAPWWGTWVPAGTAAPVVDKLEKWFQQIAALPETKDYLEKIASIPLLDGSAATAKRLQSDIDKYGPIIKAAGIEPVE